MKQSLQLRLGQHLTMTPQLQQAIRLLQLSTLELQTEVQEALDSNLMLETADDEDGSQSSRTDEQSSMAEPGAVPANGSDATSGEAVGDNPLNLSSAEEMPKDLPVDSAWEDVYEGGLYGTGAGGEAMEGNLDNQRPRAETLADYLDWQLTLTPFSERDRAIATAIVDAVDEDGYLSMDLEEAYVGLSGPDEEAISLEEVEAVLHRVQAFDPPGVAARDLRECLLIQLGQLPEDTPWRDAARNLVTEFLDLLAGRDYNRLMRRLKLDREDLQSVIGLIQGLNPRPGNQVASGEPEYIVPDIFVHKHNGAWQVALNPEAMPRVRINPYYASLVRRADSSADNNVLKSHLQEARWFLKSLQSRSETLLKVATAIVERQQGFLEHGEVAMRPLVLHDVAELVNMHESTISRVTNRKYMHTPRGIYELKYFFSSHVATDSGGECSSTAIRAMIKKLVTAESPARPLSDSKIATILSQQGIKVARRTVAKYREALAIPSSNERKRLA